MPYNSRFIQGTTRLKKPSMDLDVIEVFLVGFALNFFLDTRYMSVFYWRMDFIRKSENLPDLKGPTGQIRLAREWYHWKVYNKVQKIIALTSQDFLITNALLGQGVFLFLLTLNCMNAGTGDNRWFCLEISAGIKQSMGARNRVGIGLSYRSARLHNIHPCGIGSFESMLLKSLKIRAQL